MLITTRECRAEVRLERDSPESLLSSISDAQALSLACLSQDHVRASLASAFVMRFLVGYETPDDPQAFDRHYREVHIPLAKQLPGLGRYTVSRSASAGRGGEPFCLVAELDWDNRSKRHVIRPGEHQLRP
jgi:EthD domain